MTNDELLARAEKGYPVMSEQHEILVWFDEQDPRKWSVKCSCGWTGCCLDAKPMEALSQKIV
jgi:hypothetical protein